MHPRLKRNLNTLNTISLSSKKKRKAILEQAKTDVVKCFSDICLNICQEKFDLTQSERTALSRYKNDIRALADRKVNLANKKQILIKQSGGAFPVALLAPILSVALTLLAEQIR